MESAVRTVASRSSTSRSRRFPSAWCCCSLFEIARRFDVEMQPQLILLQKTLLNIEGLGRQLYPDLDLWKTAQPVLRALDARAQPAYAAQAVDPGMARDQRGSSLSPAPGTACVIRRADASRRRRAARLVVVAASSLAAPPLALSGSQTTIAGASLPLAPGSGLSEPRDRAGGRLRGVFLLRRSRSRGAH